MNLLARFEGIAEQLFTGVFKRTMVRLQPVEVAKELLKTMCKYKQISISKVYVPNVYRVYLNPADWGPLASFGDTFLIELSKYISQEGEQRGYTFLTKPAVELHSDQTIKLGEMFIEVDFDDSIVVDWNENEEDENAEHKNEDLNVILGNKHFEVPKSTEITTIFQNPVQTSWSFIEEESRNYNDYLEIIEGPDLGKVFNLDTEDVFLGRHHFCEVTLNDPEVSRRHLKISFSAKGWVLDDLGSTNGTFVNGQRIDRQIVVPGDEILVGVTKMVLITRQ